MSGRSRKGKQTKRRSSLESSPLCPHQSPGQSIYDAHSLGCGGLSSTPSRRRSILADQVSQSVVPSTISTTSQIPGSPLASPVATPKDSEESQEEQQTSPKPAISPPENPQPVDDDLSSLQQSVHILMSELENQR